MIFNELNKFDDIEHETVMGIWWSGILLKQKARRFFKKYPVSESQFNALMLLKYAEKPLTQQDLSERMLVDKSNVTVLVDGLEKLAFVKRGAIPGDRRSNALSITKKGILFFDGMEEEYRRLIHSCISIFTKKEMKLITDFMVRLQRGLEEEK